jgi:monoamine oxidase
MAITDNVTFWIEDHTTHLQNKTHAVLEAHTGGPIGQKTIESANPETLSKEQIASVYGNQFNQACLNKQPLTFFWSKQPYQQGAYPNLQPRQRHTIVELGKRVGNIFFAGEYTSIGHPASMNGAIRSSFKVLDELRQTIQTDVSMKFFDLNYVV